MALVQEDTGLDVAVTSFAHQYTINSPMEQLWWVKSYLIRVWISEDDFPAISKLDSSLSESSSDNVVKSVHGDFKLKYCIRTCISNLDFWLYCTESISLCIKKEGRCIYFSCSVKLVRTTRADNEVSGDWRVMGNLFTIQHCTISLFCLNRVEYILWTSCYDVGLTKDRVQWSIVLHFSRVSVNTGNLSIDKWTDIRSLFTKKVTTHLSLSSGSVQAAALLRNLVS